MRLPREKTLGEPCTSRIAQASRELRNPTGLLRAALVMMLAAGFVTPTGSAWSDVFYVISGPAILIAFWRGGFNPGCGSVNFILPVALICWSAISVFWCGEKGPHNYLYLVQGFCTLVFFAGLVVALRAPEFARAAGCVMIWFGALNAGAAVVAYPWRNGIGGRLAGFGETRQAILGASVIAVAVMFALARVLANGPKNWRLGYLAAAVVMILFVALTQSRGPLAGLAAGVLVLVLCSKLRLRILPPLLALPALLLWLDRGLRWKLTGVLTQRGVSYRLEIWQASFARIAEHPWIGHGMGAHLGYQNFTFPHDLYLSLLFYSGIVGLLLFGATVFRLLGGVLQRPGQERSLLIALWANMLVSGLTDYGQIIKGPSPLWYIVWLPIAYSVEYVLRADVLGPIPLRVGAIA